MSERHAGDGGKGGGVEGQPSIRLKSCTEALGKKIKSALEPLKGQLYTAAELDTLKTWLKLNQSSTLATQILSRGLVLFGEPAGEYVPCLYWFGGEFYLDSALLWDEWSLHYRAALRE